VQGIPYAIPAVGKLRWQEALPLSDDPRNCPTELDARRYGSKCVQLDSSSASIGSEDCLFLNIWTPANIDIGTSRLDVMVHVHDGGLMIGSGHEPCKSINCRLLFTLLISLELPKIRSGCQRFTWGTFGSCCNGTSTGRSHGMYWNIVRVMSLLRLHHVPPCLQSTGHQHHPDD